MNNYLLTFTGNNNNKIVLSGFMRYSEFRVASVSGNLEKLGNFVALEKSQGISGIITRS